MYSYTLGQTYTNYRGTDLSDRLPDQWVSAVDSLGSTKFHLESVSDSQSGEKKRTRMFLCFFLISTKSITHSDSSPYLLQWISIFLLQLYRYLVTSCFWSSPSWLRSNRLKISSVLRESTGWFDSSCPWLDAVVWLSIRPLSWASCTTTRHSSSDRKPGISDKNRKKTTVANVRTHCSLGHA